MKIKNGPIIPGVCMGNIELGITKEELLKIIGKDYQIRHLEIVEILEIENVRFWISNDKKVDQIGIGGNFKGSIEDWDELKAPIEYIYVFRVNSE